MRVYMAEWRERPGVNVHYTHMSTPELLEWERRISAGVTEDESGQSNGDHIDQIRIILLAREMGWLP